MEGVLGELPKVGARKIPLEVQTSWHGIRDMQGGPGHGQGPGALLLVLSRPAVLGTNGRVVQGGDRYPRCLPLPVLQGTGLGA